MKWLRVRNLTVLTALAVSLMGAMLLAPLASSTFAQTQAQARPRPGLALRWSATSPATHRGDRYRLVLRNGATAQRVGVSTVIMDHRAHRNLEVIREVLQLAPGERRELTAENHYGTANHFSTRIAAQHEDLTWEVTLTNSAGEQTAWFNQHAFMRMDLPQSHQPHGR